MKTKIIIVLLFLKSSIGFAQQEDTSYLAKSHKEIFELEKIILNTTKTSTKDSCRKVLFNIYVERGDIFASIGKEDKIIFLNTIDSYKEAIKIDKKNIMVNKKIGNAYFEIHDYQNTINYLEKIFDELEREQKKETAYILGISCRKENNPKACYYMTTALNLGRPNTIKKVKKYCK